MLKAKWLKTPIGNWFTAVGPFDLYVESGRERATAFITCDSKRIWSHSLRAPYDVQELMLLAEQELSRRLAEASQTLSGEVLEAPTVDFGPFQIVADPSCPRDEVRCRVGSKEMVIAKAVDGVWQALGPVRLRMP